MFTTTSLEEKKRAQKNQEEIVRSKHKKMRGKKSENGRRQDSVYKNIRTQKE